MVKTFDSSFAKTLSLIVLTIIGAGGSGWGLRTYMQSPESSPSKMTRDAETTTVRLQGEIEVLKIRIITLEMEHKKIEDSIATIEFAKQVLILTKDDIQRLDKNIQNLGNKLDAYIEKKK
jgi:hypothetical protein